MNESIPSGMSKTLLLREEALKEERDTHTYIHTHKYIHSQVPNKPRLFNKNPHGNVRTISLPESLLKKSASAD